MDITLLPTLMSENTYITLTAIVAAVCGCAAWVCTLLPAPADNASTLYRACYAILNFLGANKGKALNADDADNAAKRLS